MKGFNDSFNFCVLCSTKFQKSTIMCLNCGKKLRTTAGSSWKNKRKMKFTRFSCGHIYGDCVCRCCQADEEA